MKLADNLDGHKFLDVNYSQIRLSIIHFRVNCPLVLINTCPEYSLFSLFSFNQIFMKLADNLDRHKKLGLVVEKCCLEDRAFILLSSYFTITRAGIKTLTSLKFGQLKQFTSELLALNYSKKHMSGIMTKLIKWHVCPAKTQISLGICPV